MRLPTKAGILTLALFCTGCSWEIFPFIRNFTNDAIRLDVLSLRQDEKINDIVVFSRDTVYSMEHETIMTFKDTLKGVHTSSNSWAVEIRPNSTAIVHLPYGWRSYHYIITATRPDGRVDTLNKTLNFSVARKDKKFAHYPRAFTDDKIYFDFK